jgi:integrase/recombinase XerD
MESIARWVERYVAWLPVVGRSPRTAVTARNTLRQFAAWCEARGLGTPDVITKPILQRFQRYLYHYRKMKSDGRALTLSTQIQRLTMVRSFFRWLVRQDVLLSNPASDLEMPRQPVRLVRDVLSEAEAEAMLGVPDVEKPLGLRDRAILELFYSSGLRRLEVARLNLFDLDRGRGVVRVRRGKGDKERYVPVGERAFFWIERYVDEVRPRYACAAAATVAVAVAVNEDGDGDGDGDGENALFLCHRGRRFSVDMLTIMARGALRASGTHKVGACHVLRHTMATLMLEGGADVRHVQEMLGHASLKATQVYTHVAIGKLIAVHARTHPGAKLRPAASPALEALEPIPD